MDVLNLESVKEFQVRERVRDVVFLQNDQLYAVAQKKYTYVYNRHGTEIHCLKENRQPLKLEFLEKHFLLVGTNNFSQLHYQDISTGQVVANYRTGLGPTSVMCSNPYNSVISLGHSGGKLTMWKPTSGKPLITMLCHQGPITALAYHPSGNLVATAGLDKKIKIWDLRKFEAIHSIQGHAQTLDFSQKGLLALANGSRVQVWRDKGGQDFGLYMTHGIAKGYQIGTAKFRPYEDVLGLGHSMGFSSILIPGSGEPNFDSWVANPYETSKQRSKKEVHALLDKLPPESIMLDPSSIGMVRERQRKEKPTKKDIEQQLETAVQEAKSNVVIKKKTKGRNKPSKIAKRKEEEVFNAKRPFLEKQRDPEGAPQEKKRKVLLEVAEDLPKSLQRFVKKKSV
ncbi:putative U3 small nucleolar RNA-associated protein 7 [Carex littledalei]|uniref:Putative U3 small nucleolar RNA-associated protein 7 n=1 Tax=Carex littledalei TaxID=544730 RepID=A0A833QNK0_9POAL|nr:putative U3 small nucleolar RNA-associated protein 7 [Carex littledalei]